MTRRWPLLFLIVSLMAAPAAALAGPEDKAPVRAPVVRAPRAEATPSTTLPEDFRLFYVGRSTMPRLGAYTIFDDLSTYRRTGQRVEYWTVYFFDSGWANAGEGRPGMGGMIMHITVDCAATRYRVNASYGLLTSGLTIPLTPTAGEFQAPDPSQPGDVLELTTACAWRPPPANLTFSSLMAAAMFARGQRATAI